MVEGMVHTGVAILSDHRNLAHIFCPEVLVAELLKTGQILREDMLVVRRVAM